MHIVSPLNGAVANAAAIPVSWTVDGVAQTTALTANLIQGNNPIVRTASDAAGNVGKDSVSVSYSACYTVSGDSVHLRAPANFPCIDIQNGASLYAHRKLTAGTVRVEAGGILFTDDTLQADTVTVDSLGLISHTELAAGEWGKRVLIQAAKLRIAAGGKIDVDGKGFPGGTGPNGATATAQFTGGSHGGRGHTTYDTYPSPPTYDDYRMPILAGEGGGPEGFPAGYVGSGGGVIRVQAQNLILQGSITANGQGIFYGDGAGGSVWLTADHFSGSGRIAADGGALYSQGGGGRVALYGCDLPQNLRDSISVTGEEAGSIYKACFDNPLVHITSPSDSAYLYADHVNVHWDADGNVQTTDTVAALHDGWNPIIRCYTNAYAHSGCDTANVRVDLTPPVVKIVSPVNGSYLRGYRIPVFWTVDGMPQGEQITEDIPEGPYSIIRSYTDATGSTGADTVRVTMDNTKPLIELIQPAQSATILGTQFDLRWKVDGVEQASIHHVMDTSQANPILLRATDLAGNSDSLLTEYYSGTLVPNLVGMRHAAAESLLAVNRLAADTVWENNNGVPSGQVFAQTPAAGSALRYHWPVHIRISRGLDGVDLVPLALDAGAMTVDPITLASGGTVRVTAGNQGRAPVNAAYGIVVFEDKDRDHRYTPGADLLLGQAAGPHPIAAGDSAILTIPVSGTLTFNGNRISVMLDNADAIAETHEDNNVTQSHAACKQKPVAMDYTPQLKWGYRDTSGYYSSPFTTPVVANLTDDDGDGKIDGNDVPDVFSSIYHGGYDHSIVALDGRNGHELWHQQRQLMWPGYPAIGDLDGDGIPEIVVIEADQYEWNRRLLILDNKGVAKDSSEWRLFGSIYFGMHECVTLSDLDADGKSEIIWGPNIHDSHGKLLYPQTFNYDITRSIPVDLDGDGYKEVITNLSTPDDFNQLTSIVDFRQKKITYRQQPLRMPYPLVAAVDSGLTPFILTRGGSQWDSIGGVNSYSTALQPRTYYPPVHLDNPGYGTTLPDGDDDEFFYGTGGKRLWLSIGSSTSTLLNDPGHGDLNPTFTRTNLKNGAIAYRLFPPNMYSRGAIFDLNDDGNPESILETDDSIFVLDSTGATLGRAPADGHRWITGVSVADVDKDGHADIVVGRSYPSNLQDPAISLYSNPTWVGARSIYNQYDYRVTNVNEDNSIPRFETAHWEGLNSTNVQCTEGHYACVDISASFPQIAVNDTGKDDITARIGNGGAIELPEGIPVSVYSDMSGATSLIATLPTAKRLKAGEYYTFKCPIPDGLRGTFHFRIVADDSGNGHGKLDENNESNNSVSISFLVNNHPPQIPAIADQYAEPGEAFSLNVTATDADGDALAYALTQATPGMAINASTGLIQWTPGPNPPRCTVTVAATDPYQRTATATFLVFNGNRNNQPPQFTSVPGTIAKLNTLTSTSLEFYRYTVAATDPEGEAIEYSARCLDCTVPGGSRPALAGNQITWSPFQPPWREHDSASLEITARDARGGVATQAFVIHLIRSHNTPPAFISAPTAAAIEDQGWSTNLAVFDLDDDPVTLILDTIPTGATYYEPRLYWTPPTPGNRVIRIGATDGIDTTWQRFVLSVTPVNDAPRITSVAPVTAIPGALYAYPVQAADEEGDPLTYSLPTAPAGMTLSAQGLIQWRSPPSRTAPADVLVHVQDPNGGETTQAWQIRMVADSVPPTVAIRFSQNPVRPGHAVTVNVDAADNVSVISVTLRRNGAPVSLTADAYTFTPADTGTFAFAAQASDPQGNTGAANGLLRASQSANVSPPAITLTHTPANPHAGDLVTFHVAAGDSDGLDSTRLWVDVDGANLPVTAGQAQYQVLRPGNLQAQAVAYDVLGNSALATDAFFVAPQGGDATPPTADISSPEADSVILGQAQVLGTAFDANLAYYTLSYRDINTGTWIEFQRSASNVQNGPLGEIDATTLVNGVYEVRLDVFDRSGNSNTRSVQIQSAGEKKVGAFTLAFQDLTLPMSGTDLSVTRSYDSRVKTQGDFGYGWQMGLRSIQLTENRHQGTAWSIDRSPGLIPQYSINGSKTHTVTVTLPGGRTQQFNAEPHFFSAYNPSFGVMRYTPQAGTYSTLEAVGVDTFLVDGGDLYDQNGDFEETFNPQVYKLTLLDGSYFVVDQDRGGVIESGDANGNKVAWDANAIRHSAGETIDFARDAQGRITGISDAAGRGMQYRYDVLGNLSEVVDADGHSTKLKYGPNHYLKEIIDARGIRAARTEYDSEGRMIRQINANGDTMSIDHDLAANTETIDDFNGHQTKYTYDSAGNVLSKTDDAHHTWSYVYDSLGNVITTTMPGGASVHATFDAKGNELTHTDELGHTSTRDYDANGHPIYVHDAMGRLTQYYYDANGNNYQELGPDYTVRSFRTFDASGNVLTEKDANGEVTRHTYNAQGWLLTTTDPLGHKQSFGYDAAGNMAYEVNALGDTTRFANDANGNRLYTVDAAGDTTRTEYNAINKPVKQIDAKGRITRFEYDNLGDKIKDIAPDGSFTERAYDAQGNVATLKDAAGRITQMQYDYENRVIRTINPDNSYSRTVYDALGRRTQSIDAKGNTTAYEYDNAGRNIKVIDALNHETRFEYDVLGRKSAMIDALEQRTEYTYDGYDRLTRTRYPDNSESLTGYDAAGHKSSETDQANNTTNFEYDAVGNLTAVVDALSHRTQYTYDSTNNRLTQLDANGHNTRMDYDVLGRMVRKVYPNLQEERWSYDASGNTLSHVKGLDSTAFQYDSLNRETKRKDFPSLYQVTTTYTVDGKRENVTDYRGLTHFSYDNRGRLFREEMPNGDFLESHYDVVGNRTNSITPFGETKYRYDILNRMDTVLSPQNQATAYHYNTVGNRDSVLNANGTSTGYDALNRLTELRNRAPNGSLLGRYQYSLNGIGIRTQVTELDGSRVVYGYDNLYRLLSETRYGTHAYANSFTYDDVGNRLTQVKDGVTTTYDYNNRDQLLTESGSSGNISYTYDPAGRMKTKTNASGTTTYAWVDEDRMASVSGPGVSVQYVYDADGRRAKETAGATVKQYLIDRQLPYGQVVLETDGAGNLNAQYVYGLERISQLRTGGARWYLTDGQGSVRALTDAAGSVTDAYDYTAFGEALASTGSSVNDFKYVGEQLDPNSGFYYNRARWMDPKVGRFASVDPFNGVLLDPMSLHRYLYANASPVSFKDPTGKAAFTLNEVMATFTIASVLTAITIVHNQSSPQNHFRDMAAGQSILASLTEVENIYDALGNVIFAQNVKHYKAVIAGLIADALEHAENLTSGKDPRDDDQNENHWKGEIQAFLGRAKSIAEKYLKGKTRDQVVQEILDLAKKAGVDL